MGDNEIKTPVSEAAEEVKEAVEAAEKAVGSAAAAADESVKAGAQQETQDIQADVDAIMKKFDRESNVRIWEGIPKQIVHYLLAGFSLFLMWMNLFANWSETVRRPLFLGLVVIFVILCFPRKKGQIQKPNFIPIYDVLLMIAGGTAFFYFVLNEKDLMFRATRITKVEIALGVIGTLVLFECCRRVVGLPILFVASAFII